MCKLIYLNKPVKYSYLYMSYLCENWVKRRLRWCHGCVLSSHRKPWDAALYQCHNLRQTACKSMSRHMDYCKISILTHWGWVMHICIDKLTIIGSENGLSSGQRQAIIWTNAGILLFLTLGTNVSEILSQIYIFSLKIMHLNMSSEKWGHLVLASMC